MADVRLESVSKCYPGATAPSVDSFSLTIADGEFLVLVGPSGCGKSTTLRMIAGLEETTAGRILIGGRDVTRVPPKDRDIAMVFQNYALYPHMTVRENMSFGLRLRGFPKAEIARRVDEAAESLGLGALMKRLPKQLSGGQRQRVALGRAIVRQPAVFLFDEPLSNLDAKMRVEMRSEIRRLHDRLKATMVYVTHDQAEAMTMGDRVVVMKDGVIRQVASPLEIYRNPADVFVAGFIGTPPMNLIVEGERTLGFRPEAVSASVDSPGLRAFEGQVEGVELTGAESFVHVRLASGEMMIARLPADAGFRLGDRARFGVAPGRILEFSTKDGRRR